MELQKRAEELVKKAVELGSMPMIDGNWIKWTPPPPAEFFIEILEFCKSAEANDTLVSVIRAVDQ